MRTDGAVLRLNPGETAVVGYGSLISKPSIGRTLGRPYAGFFAPCHVAGWRRSWDVAMPNAAYYFVAGDVRHYPQRIAYLNVRTVPGEQMNAVVFVLGEKDLDAMHQREWIYEPRVVTAALGGVTLEGGDAIMYVARPEFVVAEASDPRDVAVRGSYLRILEQGLANMDEAFGRDYEASTDPVPRHLVIEDRQDDQRGGPAAVANTPR